MKRTRLLRQTAPLAFAFAATSSLHATLTGTIAPLAVNWANVADTAVGTLALDPTGVPIVPPVNFQKFDPPVVSEFSQAVTFKGWLVNGAPVTSANDEGVWSTAPKISSSFIPHIPTLVLREADPVTGSSIGATYGSAGLNVENLQVATNDWTVCMTNVTPAGAKVAIGYNGLVQHILGESATAAWSDIRPPVITSFSSTGAMAMWKRETAGPFRSGVQHIPFSLPATVLAPFWDTGFSGSYRNNQPPRIASPSISDGGWVAAYARDFVAPANHIQLRSATGGPASVIVREGDATLTAVPGFIPATSRFGIIHNKLMANSDSPTAGSELVAWQMQTMLFPALAQTSLWCKYLGSFRCLAYQNQPAPDLPAGNNISSFYALHAVPDFSNPGEHWVFWGAMISPGANKVAIYRTHVGTTVSPPDLIASNVAGTSFVGLLSGGLQAITAIDRFFSVNVHGTVLFKASCAGAPVGKRQILVTAGVVGGHARQVRAQSGIATAGVPIPSLSTTVPATNFQLATPEQGPCGRGQAIGVQWITAKILYSSGAGQGIFFGQ